LRGCKGPVLATIVLITMTLALITPIPVVASMSSKAVLTVFPDGWVDVLLETNLTLSSRGVSLKIDGEPHHLIVVGDGLLVNYTLKGNKIVVQAPGIRHLSVSYQTPSLTTKTGPVWNLTFDLDVNSSQVRLINECVILGMSDIPDRLELAGSWLIIDFKGGRHWISYKLTQKTSAPQITPSTTGNMNETTENVRWRPSTSSPPITTSSGTQTPETSSFTPASFTRSTEKAESQLSQETSPFPYVYLLPLGVASLAIILLALRGRGRKGRMVPEATDELEQRILEFLEERGGRAMQSEIIRSMDAPRATVWRRLRRMEREGKVRLTKEGRFTVVELPK